MSNVDTRIKELEKQAAKLAKLKAAFPDLKEDTDRWKSVRYYAASANEKCTGIELRHSCGCCNDAPLYAMPFLKFEGEEIYAEPLKICIGQRNYSYTDLWDSDWRKKIAKHGIPEKAIESIAKYAKTEEEEYEDEDE